MKNRFLWADIQVFYIIRKRKKKSIQQSAYRANQRHFVGMTFAEYVLVGPTRELYFFYSSELWVKLGLLDVCFWVNFEKINLRIDTLFTDTFKCTV